MTTLEQAWAEAQKLKNTDKGQYRLALEQIVNKEMSKATEDNLKVKENAILALGELFSEQSEPKFIYNLIQNNKSVFNDFPKAKTAKIMKSLIDYVAKIPGTLDIQIDLCKYLIQWCKEEKRSYLRHRIEIRLASLYFQNNSFKTSLEIIDNLLKEVRKADDKHLLVEIQLQESKVHHALQNFAKAKASLTASRACANSIYCPPLIQADIDMTSGILHAEDKDYKTAYSYFYESFEAFHNSDDSRAIQALKYMLLSKIMTNSIEDINALLRGKFGLKYAGKDLDAMMGLMHALSNKSLKKFQDATKSYPNEIEGDPIIKQHIEALYEKLLEENLFNLIEPYSRVQIDHISTQIGLDIYSLQNKLSEMILDNKINGTLDQGNGCLIIFDELECDKLYDNALDTINNMNNVMDKLFEKVKLIKQN